MKCIKIIPILLVFHINFSLKQWPKVDNVKKSRTLPSLEVKMHAPDEFQPKVQAEISRLEEKREQNERTWMQDLEQAYNTELEIAGKQIDKIIKDAISIFDDPNLFYKSVEYAINPPLVIMTNNMLRTDIPNVGNYPNPNKALGLSFKEMAKIKMNKLQKETMKILVDDDNQIENLRKAKVNIQLDDKDHTKQTEKSNPKKNPNFHFKQDNKKMNLERKHPQFQNGPINLNKLYKKYFAFVELESSTTQKGQGGLTKPISVVMKLPKEPDPKIKKEIGTLESKRESLESKLFKKAKEEFKLITALTIKELQINLDHELLPFYIVSKNSLMAVNSIITSTVPSQTINTSPGLLRIDPQELMEKFPNLRIDDQLNLVDNTYGKIIDLFSEGPKLEPNPAMLNNEALKELNSNNIKSKFSSAKMPDKKALRFNFKECEEISRNLKHINCNDIQEDYDALNKSYTSFLEMKQSGGDDLINVKFASSDEPYPTIEKLVAQTMTRRDLAEKFERLKILEYQSHLQKAENEMIQDVLHENLLKIISFYGPAIEGMKEHIH